MMQFKKFLLAFLFFLIISGLLISHIHLFIGDFLTNQTEMEADYLENLRNSTEFGCKTVLARNPELLLIGNSGSYATWDMHQLENMTGLKVGGCMMGGATVETYELIVDLTTHLPNPPKFIIIGASIYAFLKPESYSVQLNDQKGILRRSRFPYQFLIDIAWKKFLHDRAFPVLASDQERLVAIHRIPMEANANFVDKIISDYLLSDIDKAKKLNSAQRFDDFGIANISNICSKIKSMNTRLLVINIPTSPQAEKAYTDDLWTYYTAALRGFDQCADKIIPFRSPFYGLKNYHYVNRMLDVYPYDKWKNGESYDLLYDIDHPNFYGAEVFTKKALNLLFGDDIN